MTRFHNGVPSGRHAHSRFPLVPSRAVPSAARPADTSVMSSPGSARHTTWPWAPWSSMATSAESALV
jgi:hypothetical protein